MVIKNRFPDFADEIENNSSLLKKYHSVGIFKEYSSLKDEQKVGFLFSKGLNEKFMKNTELINILRANKDDFKNIDIENIIYQTKLTPSSMGEMYGEYDILTFIYQQNQNNAEVSFKNISKDFGIVSKTTAKRIRMLENKGLIFIKKRGRLKTLYVSQKGKTLLHERHMV